MYIESSLTRRNEKNNNYKFAAPTTQMLPSWCSCLYSAYTRGVYTAI